MHRTLRLCALALIPLLFPFFASAASLYLDPSVGTYGPGDTFGVNVRLNTDAADCINAAQVDITYPAATLRAVDFSRGSSIFSLWITDPQINTDAGTVDFEGGVPGGYCGRIPGDPAISNVLGEIIFSVVGSSTKAAEIRISPGSVLYKNDGLGTKVVPTLTDATISIAPTPQLSSNPWLSEVSADTIPPQPFTVQVESTRGVFDGKYYVVFSTVDNQSGLDHYEIFENGAWNRVTSPHVLADQSLKSPIEVRAIDKAGNIRLGTYTPGTPPPRQYSLADILPPFGALALILIIIALIIYLRHKKTRGDIVDLRT